MRKVLFQLNKLITLNKSMGKHMLFNYAYIKNILSSLLSKYIQNELCEILI